MPDGAAPRMIARLRRAGRRTNLGLFVALTGAFLTGFLAFAAGTPVPATVATTAHGLLGLTVVALVPWKRVVIGRVPLKTVRSLLLLATVAVCLLSGFALVFVGFVRVAGLDPIQLHVGSAVVAIPLFVEHVVRHRRNRAGRRQRVTAREDLSRRNLLRTGWLAAGVAAGYAALEGVGRLAGLPSADRRETGSHELALVDMPATIWLFDSVPAAGEPAVHIDGTAVALADLRARAVDVDATLDCTSGWYVNARWRAVSIADLTDPLRRAAAQSVVVTSTTGYQRRFPVDQADRLWLATGLRGREMTRGLGAPLRLVAPGRRGFWWVKWVRAVDLSDEPSWWQSPFPLQ